MKSVKIYGLGVIGTIGFFVASLLFDTHKISFYCISVPSGICFLLSIFLYWNNSHKKNKQNNIIEYNHNLVAEWRKMVHEVANQHDKSDKSISHLLERHKSYYSLKPHLSQNTIKQITRNTIFISGTTIDSALQYILRDIANFEKNKGLL